MTPEVTLRFQQAIEAIDKAEDADTIMDILLNLFSVQMLSTAIDRLAIEHDGAGPDIRHALYRNVNTPPNVLFKNSLSDDWPIILQTPLVPFYLEAQDPNLFEFLLYHYLYASPITLHAATWIDTHYPTEPFVAFWERKLEAAGAPSTWLPIPRPSKKLARSKEMSKADLERWDQALKIWYKQPPYSRGHQVDEAKDLRDTTFGLLANRSEHRMMLSTRPRSESFSWRMSVLFFAGGEPRTRKPDLSMITRYVAFLHEFYDMMGEPMPSHPLADVLGA